MSKARDRATDAKLCFGTVDSYLIWRLSKAKATLLTPRMPVGPLFDVNTQLESITDALISGQLLPEVLDNALLLQQPTPNGLARYS